MRNFYSFDEYITENPDTVVLDNTELKYNDSDALAFGYLFGEFKHSGKFGEPHSKIFVNDYEMFKKYGQKYLDHFFMEEIDMIESKRLSRSDLEYSGRVWINRKVISFWEYPKDLQGLLKIFKDINEYSKGAAANLDEWKIEVIYKLSKETFIGNILTVIEDEDVLKEFFVVENVPDNVEDSAIRVKFKNENYNWSGVIDTILREGSTLFITTVQYNYKKGMIKDFKENKAEVYFQGVDTNQIIIDENDIGSNWDNISLKRTGYDVNVIPVNSYTNSVSFSEDIVKQFKHEMTPAEKEKIKTILRKQGINANTPQGVGSKKIPKDKKDVQSMAQYRARKYQESIISFGQFKLNESPDSLIIGEIKHRYYNSDTYSFGINPETGEMLISLKNQPHDSIHDTENEYFDRETLKFPGRIWTKHKVINFWVFPDRDDFLKAVFNLSKILDIDILNTYNVEIISGPNEEIKKLESDYGEEWVDDDLDGTHLKLEYIPCKDYKGSLEYSEEERKQDHTDSPLDKNNEVPDGFGSKKTPEDKIDTQSMAQYRAKKYQEDVIVTLDEYNLFLEKINE